MDDERLALAIRSRRTKLMLSQNELASAAGVSEATIRSIEANRRSGLRVSTRRSISKALGWSADSIDRILDGLEPALLDSEPPADLQAEIARLRGEIDRLWAAIETKTDAG